MQCGEADNLPIQRQHQAWLGAKLASIGFGHHRLILSRRTLVFPLLRPSTLNAEQFMSQDRPPRHKIFATQIPGDTILADSDASTLCHDADDGDAT